jgi:hypothetical protein
MQCFISAGGLACIDRDLSPEIRFHIGHDFFYDGDLLVEISSNIKMILTTFLIVHNIFKRKKI